MAAVKNVYMCEATLSNLAFPEQGVVKDDAAVYRECLAKKIVVV